ncbi:MAG TPA: hypothetical protein VJ583_09355 [Nitrososphaeraceae archaeon]|nr:hypothetical protein [Nitrososphaeraceae archaeon]
MEAIRNNSIDNVEYNNNMKIEKAAYLVKVVIRRKYDKFTSKRKLKNNKIEEVQKLLLDLK